MDDMRNIYENVSFHIKTPEGTANIIIAEEEPGVIYEIFFSIGKAGAPINAWAYAVAKLVVDSLHRGASINDMIELLSNITSSRPMYDKDGIACRSGPEALYLALMKYRILNKDNFAKKVTYKEDYRGPKLTGGR